MSKLSRLLFPVVIFALSTTTAPAADQPGTIFHIVTNDLPNPYATAGVANPPQRTARPPTARPAVPRGFTVSLYATGLTNPRWLAVAPSGDVFVAEPSAGRITLLHAKDGKVEASSFADGCANRMVWSSHTAHSLSATWKRCGGSPTAQAH